MEIVLLIIALGWAVLNIILFFKVWSACDDIRRVADKIDPEGKMRKDAAKKRAEEESYTAMLEDN